MGISDYYIIFNSEFLRNFHKNQILNSNLFIFSKYYRLRYGILIPKLLNFQQKY
jgi:hypothetical protein